MDREQRILLRRWLEELDADEWDREIERDAEAGLLDRLAQEAVQAHEAGTTREL